MSRRAFAAVLGVIAVLGFVGFAYLVVTRIQAILAVPT